MYQIKCDGYILHDIRVEGLQVISPKCTLQLNKTGILSFKMPPTHPYYNTIKKHKSEITLYQDDTVLFCGRVLNDEIDFYNIKNVECEGDLAYFLDSLQRPKEHHIDGGTNNAIELYLRDIIGGHNGQVEDKKKFTVGRVTVRDTNNYVYKISNFENTLSCLSNKLIGTYGGYLRVRHVDNERIIDYLAEIDDECNQTMEFGKNIIDITRYIKGEDIFTALIPLGAKGEEEGALPIDISGIADEVDGTIHKTFDYVFDAEAVEKYGWIWRVETWENVTLPQNLYTKAKQLLKNAINEAFIMELTAIDLYNLGIDVDKIALGYKIQAISPPHNINQIMIVEKMEIDIEKPQNSKFILTLPEKFISKDVSISGGKTDSDKQIQEVKELVETNIQDTDSKYISVDPISEIRSIDDIKDWVDNTHITVPSDSDIKTIEDIKEWTGDNHIQTVEGDPIKDITDLKEWTDNTHLKTDALDDIKSVSDMKDWVSDNYVSKTGGDGIDLSEYAKIVDVNEAFSQLANALGGV